MTRGRIALQNHQLSPASLLVVLSGHMVPHNSFQPSNYSCKTFLVTPSNRTNSIITIFTMRSTSRCHLNFMSVIANARTQFTQLQNMTMALGDHHHMHVSTLP